MGLMVLQPHTQSPTMTPPLVAAVTQLLSQLPLVGVGSAAMCLKSLPHPAIHPLTLM